jgi:group II intron maturase
MSRRRLATCWCRQPRSWAEVRDTLNRSLLGWANYFCLGTCRSAFRSVDRYVYERVRAAPTSCARLQSWQLSPHACNTGANQGLVADELEKGADQDRDEGGEPRMLCRLPNGGGRHPTTNVPGDSAADRGTTAAATTSASVRRSMSCIQEQPTEGVRPNARENAQIRPSTKRSGYPRCW